MLRCPANLLRVRSIVPLWAYGSSLGAQRDHHIEQGAGASDAPKHERDHAEYEGDSASQPQQQRGSVSGRGFGHGSRAGGLLVISAFFLAPGAIVLIPPPPISPGAALAARESTSESRPRM